MRVLAIAFSFLPGLGMADTVTMSHVLDAQNWVFAEARCSDVISLFTTPKEFVEDVPEDISMRLLFASTVIRGVAMGRGVSYGEFALEWGAFCVENPDSGWLTFLQS